MTVRGNLWVAGLVILSGICFPVKVVAQEQKEVEKAVAVVNGEAITVTEWANALHRLPVTPTPLTETQRKALQMELLALLIDDLLLRQYVRQQVPATDPMEVQRRVAELERSLKTRQLTLQDYLRETHQTEAQLRAGIAAEGQWRAYVDQRLKDVDLKKYYEENRDLFDGTLIRVSHIVVTVPPGSDPKTVQQAVTKLEEARKAILQGRDFGEVARQTSQDGSASLGGDLGYFPPRKADNDAFIRTASHLKPGQVSDVVRTDYGCHLIKVTDYKPGKPSTFEELRDTVRAVYADEMKLTIIQQQRKVAKIHVLLP
jgi:parvulin-like peptidyl-prolyl isomerase